MPLIRKDPETKPVARDAARPTLASASSQDRWAAVRDMPVSAENISLLSEALSKEEDKAVREALFTALARIATPDSIAVIIPYVRSDDASLRTGAMDALRGVPNLVIPHLQSMLGDSDPDVRVLACDLGRVLTDRETPKLLYAILESDPNGNVCGAAVEVVAEIGDADGIASLLRCADRFPSDPFLSFAIKSAVERLQTISSRG